ncbi:hypothetical protein LINPERPRIM_LOCUS11204 [Linum perenne]
MVTMSRVTESFDSFFIKNPTMVVAASSYFQLPTLRSSSRSPVPSRYFRSSFSSISARASSSRLFLLSPSDFRLPSRSPSSLSEVSVYLYHRLLRLSQEIAKVGWMANGTIELLKAMYSEFYVPNIQIGKDFNAKLSGFGSLVVAWNLEQSVELWCRSSRATYGA